LTQGKLKLNHFAGSLFGKRCNKFCRNRLSFTEDIKNTMLSCRKETALHSERLELEDNILRTL